VKGTVSLRDLYEQYSDRIQFLMIYIREAHPVDGWWLGGGLPGKVLSRYEPRAATDVYDPKTIDERRGVAEQCSIALEFGIPTLVDDIDDSVNKAYAALPTRLYLIDEDGRVAYAAAKGPWGFKPAELKEAIEELLG
jgi:hypothetical protein